MRQVISKEVKRDVLNSIIEGEDVKALAKKYSIAESTIYGWVAKTDIKLNNSRKNDRKEKVRNLQETVNTLDLSGMNRTVAIQTIAKELGLTTRCIYNYLREGLLYIPAEKVEVEREDNVAIDKDIKDVKIEAHIEVNQEEEKELNQNEKQEKKVGFFGRFVNNIKKIFVSSEEEEKVTYNLIPLDDIYRMKWWELDTYIMYAHTFQQQNKEIEKIGINDEMLSLMIRLKEKKEETIRSTIAIRSTRNCDDELQLYFDLESIELIKEIDDTNIVTDLIRDIISSRLRVKIGNALRTIINAYGFYCQRSSLEGILCLRCN